MTTQTPSAQTLYKTYLVGGAVRDALMGLAPMDCDFVVVGASPEVLLAQGYTAVGKDFPVFLHPNSHQEYALARTERMPSASFSRATEHSPSAHARSQVSQRTALRTSARNSARSLRSATLATRANAAVASAGTEASAE